jgi:hypothetical protein
MKVRVIPPPDRGPKPWQHGYDINYLLDLEARFAEFNAYARGPFLEMNKRNIADRLHKQTMAVFNWGIINSVYPRNPGPIYCYHRVPIASKLAGDQVIDAFCYDDREKMIAHLSGQRGSTFLWIWQESADERDIAEKAGYEFIACKFTSMGEIRGLWYKDADYTFFPRLKLWIPEYERVGMARVGIPLSEEDLSEAVLEIAHITTKYTDHYSSYNKKHSWSALSLRGYTSDPAFITKPDEMNKKWWEEHSVIIDGERVRNTYKLQDTPLRLDLPSIEKLHAPLTKLSAVHRIRLMKLEPGGGELQRHTDQVDKDSGIADGKVARFHIPLITNSDVMFGSWDLDGNHHKVNMTVGECWYLDTRKPHTATNNGTLPRIHLVVDVESNANVRALLSSC